MPDLPPRSSGVLTYLDGRVPLRRYEHLACVHAGGAETWGAEFLSGGVAEGHWCCYLAPPSLHPLMLTRLRELGVDPERQLNARTLQFPAPAQDAASLLDRAERFFADAEAAHAPAIRWLEVGLAAKPETLSIPRFFELHARLNYLVKQYPSAALCDYDAEQMETPHLLSVIAIHRHLLVEGTLVRDNPFYKSPEKFLSMSPEDRERDLREVFREVGFDRRKLLASLAGYGQLQRPASSGF